jgi:hypothetical protein
MRGTGDMCTGCGNMHPEAEPLTFGTPTHQARILSDLNPRSSLSFPLLSSLTGGGGDGEEAMQNWEAPGFPWADKVDHVLQTGMCPTGKELVWWC